MDHQSALHQQFQTSQLLRMPADVDECPSCGQTIPPEKLEEIKGKIALNERERTLAITGSLRKQYEQQSAAVEAKHRLQMNEWQESITVATAGRKAAEAQVLEAQEEKLAAVEAARVSFT